MPVMDGLTATQLIRKWERENGRAPTPIIALSASALEDDVKRSLAAGCTDHVSKPVKKAVLLEAIRGVSSKRKIIMPLAIEENEASRDSPST
jgi:CheY-like chemotaxis protein